MFGSFSFNERKQTNFKHFWKFSDSHLIVKVNAMLFHGEHFEKRMILLVGQSQNDCMDIVSQPCSKGWYFFPGYESLHAVNANNHHTGVSPVKEVLTPQWWLLKMVLHLEPVQYNKIFLLYLWKLLLCLQSVRIVHLNYRQDLENVYRLWKYLRVSKNIWVSLKVS